MRWYLAAVSVIAGFFTISVQRMRSPCVSYQSMVSSACKRFSAVLKQVQPHILKKTVMSNNVVDAWRLEEETVAPESSGSSDPAMSSKPEDADTAALSGQTSGQTSGSPAVKNRKKWTSDRPKHIAPNAFVSLPIANAEVKQRMSELQERMINLDKSIEPLRISPDKFHLTLMVMKLDEDTQSSNAQGALEEAAQTVTPDLSGVSFQLDRLSMFGKEVAFVTFSDEQAKASFTDAAAKVREIFERRGLPSTDSRPPNPHVTLFKVDGKRRKGKKPTHIPVELHQKITDCNCGIEVFNTLQLCSMTKPKRPDGYYHILHETSLNREKADDQNNTQLPAT